MKDLLANQDAIYLIYSGIAVGILVLFSGIGQLLDRKENRSEARSRRLRLIAQGKTTEELIALLRPPENRGFLASLPLLGTLPSQLRKAGYTVSPRVFMFFVACGTAALFLLATRFLPMLQALGVSLIVGLLLPVMVVRARCQKRMDALVHQLPDALDLMARGLRVGHPLNTSIGAVANEMPDPIGSEFGLIFDQVNYGDDLVDAFHEFAERVEIEDVNYLATSIGIQHGTGGDLVRVITILSRTIRNRIAMRRRIGAISAEGRMTAWFLSLLPFFIFGSTSILNPTYYGGVMEDPKFKPIAIAIVAFVVLNAVILRRLVNFRI